MCRRKTMNYRSKYPVFSGLWKLELQLFMKADLSCINLPGIWVLPKPKGASSALFVDDSCSPNEARVYISRGQCLSVNFSGWVSAFFASSITILCEFIGINICFNCLAWIMDSNASYQSFQQYLFIWPTVGPSLLSYLGYFTVFP